MRKTFKSFIAIILVFAFTLGLSGCYSEDNLIAATREGYVDVPVGGYAYFVYNAYNDAMGKVGTDTEVLKATIEEKAAETWIRDRAFELVQIFYFVEEKFESLELTLSEDDLDSAQSNTSYLWNLTFTAEKTYGDLLSDFGCSEESFHLVYSLFNVKYQRIFDAVYGEGGEKEVTDEEFISYFDENYLSYAYFTAPTTTTDEEGETVDMTNAEIDEVRRILEEYQDAVDSGEKTLEDAAADHAANVTLSASTYQNSYTAKSSATSEILAPLIGLDDNETLIIENSPQEMVLAQKLPISERSAEVVESESERSSVIDTMKSEEFSEYIEESAKDISDIVMNKKAVNHIRLSWFKTDDNKMGTSSVPEESAVSSDIESSDASQDNASSDISDNEEIEEE